MANVATMKASAATAETPGRVVIAARDHRLTIDAPPLIGGTNEEMNPVEMFLGSLAACGVLFIQRVASEIGVTLEDAQAFVEGDFDPRGVKGEDVEADFQVIRFRYEVKGPDKEEAQKLVEGFRQRCPLYRSVAKAVAISEELLVVEA